MKPSPTISYPVLNDTEFQNLAALDSCSVANAIEDFDHHLRNEGFSGNALACRFPEMPPMLGYAFTLQVRSSAPPMRGKAYFSDTLWWNALLEVPTPRILVVQDMDEAPGAGALVGDLHAQILKSLGCIGVVTNGSVRDLPQVRPLGFHLYSAFLSVSHSYSHVTHMGEPVVINGLKVSTGDLLHGDCHGIVRVPLELAAQVPAVVQAAKERDQKITDYCQSPERSVEGLRSLLKN